MIVLLPSIDIGPLFLSSTCFFISQRGNLYRYSNGWLSGWSTSSVCICCKYICKQTLHFRLCPVFDLRQRMEAFLLLRKGAFAVASSLCLDKYMYIHYIYKSIYCIQLETWIPFSFLPWCCVLIRQTRHFPEYLLFLLTQKATNDKVAMPCQHLQSRVHLHPPFVFWFH